MMNSYTNFRRHAHIVNRMMSMTSASPLSLPDIIRKLPNTARYNTARPCRIYWRFEDRIPVQIFPKGTIQILGRHAKPTACEQIRNFLTTHLSLSLSRPCLNSCTVFCRIARHLSSLNRLPSNHHESNEYELFFGLIMLKSFTLFEGIKTALITYTYCFYYYC